MDSLPKLCYITDRTPFASFTAFSDFLVKAAKSEIDLIQIRERNLDTRALVKLVSHALASARADVSRIVINDRLDVALATGAAGVHLGARSLPACMVRKIIPPDFLAGVSCHSLDEAVSAEAAGADYVLLGPIFETPSKLAFGPPLGLATIETAAHNVKLPVLALGGVTVERVKSCVEAGASGIAGIRIFQECDSIEDRVQELRAALSK
jgi:thiamine-phosphate pyrophosphorylase